MSTRLTEIYGQLKTVVNDPSLEEDVRKAEGGNAAAGTRVRKAMQDAKAAAQELREKVLENRNAGKPE
jgi:hypothetical protein